MLSRFLFILTLIVSLSFFLKNTIRIYKRIRIGINQDTLPNPIQSFKNLILIAIGQNKILQRPVSGQLHSFVFIGFIFINIGLIEFVIDGIAGTHRIFDFNPYYTVYVSILELLALLVIFSSVILLFRRKKGNTLRFDSIEITKKKRIDALIILFAQIILMLEFILINALDQQLQLRNVVTYPGNNKFLISSLFISFFNGIDVQSLIIIERSVWWLLMICLFSILNYIPFSKQFHILISFSNVYHSSQKPLSYISNMNQVTTEVKIAMGLLKETKNDRNVKIRYGANDVTHLSRKSLMDAYSCTECGRCTMVCPAYIAGKKLSPRKIVMDVRQRLEEYDRSKRNNNIKLLENVLLRNYVTEEEIWACTTCNACIYECPLNIDPVKILIELRRYIFMEEASAPVEIKVLSENIEKNGSPWSDSSADRDNWTRDLYWKI